MTPPAVARLDAAGDIRRALDRAAEALAAPDLDALLACESALADAVERARHVRDLSPQEAGTLRAELDHARDALARCRRLGSSLTEFVRLSLEAQGRAPEYGPPRGRPSSGLQTRE